MPVSQEKNPNLYRYYLWATVALGGAIYVFAGMHVQWASLDLRFAVLVAVTLILSSRLNIKLPHFSSQISVSDTFIFLTLLLYGAEVAIVLAATEALLSSLHFSRRPQTIFFNWACAASATCLTALILHGYIGDIVELNRSDVSAKYVAAITVMALSQYVANSGLVAICGALKVGKPIWQTWRKHFLWTSITYFAGASSAALIAKFILLVGFYSLLITVPVIAVIFFTYRTYIQNIEHSTSQAEQAERHIHQLSHYIEEQERIREQFSQIEKLSALGELASGVAHDFNNTLAGILGRAQLLLRSDDPEKIKRGLQIIIKTAEDGAKTVKRIQDFARQRRDHDFELVAVDQILLDVSEITRPRWKDRAEASNIHINLEVRIRSNAKIMGDESELREVLVNMVFNAIDAMPNGGQLTLAAEDVDDTVVITIADNGCGMTPEVRSRIFDPFFTTKGKAGMGLGLAVGFGIIRRHEGVISVESEVSRGTIFRITLPAAKNCLRPEFLESGFDSNNGEAQSGLASAAGPEFQPRILVVDDELFVRELLQDLLESQRCKVTLAEGGHEALALFEAQQFDAVFTDVGMPGMSGWELAYAIRQHSEDIPIAVIT